MVNQVSRLGGRWSMKINHSASPRNRSSRSSRSPTAGNEIAGALTAAAAGALLAGAAAEPSTRSVIDVIRHRVRAGGGRQTRRVYLPAAEAQSDDVLFRARAFRAI